MYEYSQAEKCKNRAREVMTVMFKPVPRVTDHRLEQALLGKYATLRTSA
ncbi:hypothetical protein [Vibrio gigantis]|nr:hypothetical protein [Vibrio gigantis]